MGCSSSTQAKPPPQVLVSSPGKSEQHVLYDAGQGKEPAQATELNDITVDLPKDEASAMTVVNGEGCVGEIDSALLARIRWGQAIVRVVANGNHLDGELSPPESPRDEEKAAQPWGLKACAPECLEGKTTSSTACSVVNMESAPAKAETDSSVVIRRSKGKKKKEGAPSGRSKKAKRSATWASVAQGVVLQQRHIQRRPNEMKAQRKVNLASFCGKKQSFGIDQGEFSRWTFDERDGYQIRVSAHNKVDPIQVDTKEEAIAMVKRTPHKYFGCEWVQEGYEGGAKVYKITTKVFHEGFGPFEEQPDALGAMVPRYRALNPDVRIPPDRRGKEDVLLKFGKHKLEARQPGRGQGVADMPGLKVVGDVDPSDLFQGTVGNCWLLSAISSLAEFDGAILRMFRTRSCLGNYPAEDEFNIYTITLWNLETFEPVDVEVDESLIFDVQAGGLLGCRPSLDGELWGCYIEKAVALHCGGWDAINGGLCTHAWQLLTGTREVYTIKRKNKNTGFRAYGSFNPNTHSWERLCTAPHKSFSGLWPMKWPEVGGGGDIGQEFNEEQLFMKMCAWDDHNFVVCAGTKPGSDQVTTSGLADGHCYTVVSVLNDAGGTSFDMLQVRNPWGSGEFDAGDWRDGGENWSKYPEVFEACGSPQDRDDGVFWMEKKDFFEHFVVVYVCAVDMSQFGCEQAPPTRPTLAVPKVRPAAGKKRGGDSRPTKKRHSGRVA